MLNRKLIRKRYRLDPTQKRNLVNERGIQPQRKILVGKRRTYNLVKTKRDRGAPPPRKFRVGRRSTQLNKSYFQQTGSSPLPRTTLTVLGPDGFAAGKKKSVKEEEEEPLPPSLFPPLLSARLSMRSHRRRGKERRKEEQKFGKKEEREVSRRYLLRERGRNQVLCTILRPRPIELGRLPVVSGLVEATFAVQHHCTKGTMRMLPL